MKIYEVGGCVRDRLLGFEPKDYDYVVVGATHQQMINLGFSQVGASFPVYLHPTNGNEYALARKERKTGVGYHGFDVTFDSSVSLEDDLMRRDLTINSMATDPETGATIDPYGGLADLRQGILRHTSEAFAEDPVRVLRTARFAARYGFTVHASTNELMRKVVPELDHVAADRVFAEIHKGLMEEKPWLMFEALEACGAFVNCAALKPYAQHDDVHLIESSDTIYTRFSLVARGFKDSDYATRKVTTDLQAVSKAVNKHVDQMQNWSALHPIQRLEILDRLRAFSDPGLMTRVACAVDASMRRGRQTAPVSIQTAMQRDLQAAQRVDAAQIASTCTDGKQIRQAISWARLKSMSN